VVSIVPQRSPTISNRVLCRRSPIRRFMLFGPLGPGTDPPSGRARVPSTAPARDQRRRRVLWNSSVCRTVCSAGARLLCKEVANEWEKFVIAGSNLYRLCFRAAHADTPVRGRGSLQCEA
jgi:hypothetical protein